MHVLYVEDDPVNRRVMKAILSASGAEMAEALDGQAGVEALDKGDYDVVLMDLRMPGMDGLTAIRHIRARGDEKGKIPIIVVTADIAPSMREDCIAAGANDVLHKPIAVKGLYAAIGEAIANRKA